MYILWIQHCNYQNTPNVYAVKPSIYESVRLYYSLHYLQDLQNMLMKMSINYLPIFFYTTLISIAHSNRWNCLYYSFELNEHLYIPNKTKKHLYARMVEVRGIHVHDNEYLKANNYVLKNGNELIKGSNGFSCSIWSYGSWEYNIPVLISWE
jgi:hypothetical protein